MLWVCWRNKERLSTECAKLVRVLSNQTLAFAVPPCVCVICVSCFHLPLSFCFRKVRAQNAGGEGDTTAVLSQLLLPREERKRSERAQTRAGEVGARAHARRRTPSLCSAAGAGAGADGADVKVKVVLLITILQSLPTLERSPNSLIIQFLLYWQCRHSCWQCTRNEIGRARERKYRECTGSDFSNWSFS